MSYVAYGTGVWLLLVGVFGVTRSGNLIHTVVCVSVAQSGTYVLLLAVGYQSGAVAPIFGPTTPPGSPVVDPVVQAMTLTDIVVSATVTALLLALVIQVAKRHGTIVPDELHALRG
ncbi:MAG TPA: cation:proton antiporter subunit C [Pseudonocardiaceae bacterium]|nr:cation:proton antiporter subunit C [Pseudonocardiaceae bacterium]